MKGRRQTNKQQKQKFGGKGKKRPKSFVSCWTITKLADCKAQLGEDHFLFQLHCNLVSLQAGWPAINDAQLSRSAFQLDHYDNTPSNES